MGTRNINQWPVALSCVIGLVCAGSVAGQDRSGPQDADEAIDLFESQAPDELPQGQTVEVSSFGQIELHVQDLDLTKVLQLLSIQSQRNIIASRNVGGTISADLYAVDFYQALDAILHTNGFGYREQGHFIYVYTSEELQQIEDDLRQTVSKVVRLSYISAADASAFVSPLLSSAGSISVSAQVAAGIQPSISSAGADSFAYPGTLLIVDFPEHIEQIMAILEEIDIRPFQVLIEAVILQATLAEDNVLGVDFSFFTDLNITNFSDPLGAVDDLITGAVSADSAGVISSTPGDTGSGRSSIKLGFLSSDFAVFVKALDSVVDTTVLANPKLLVLDRQRADLLVGQRLGYLSTTNTDTSSTQTVEFLDVGTQLSVRPFVSAGDNSIRLELRPSLSDGSTALVGDTVIPDTTTQELITNVIVNSGQTVVLGGLFKEDTDVSRQQVPGLGTIPWLGAAFKGQGDEVGRSEVIFMVKPTVMKDKVLYAMGEETLDGARLRGAGARAGLLPWSRTKMTAAQIRDALKYFDAGDTDKALWHVNLALHFDPTLVDALRLKEQLTGQSIRYDDFSILRHAIDSAIDAQVGLSAPIDEATEPAPFTEGEASGQTIEDLLWDQTETGGTSGGSEIDLLEVISWEVEDDRADPAPVHDTPAAQETASDDAPEATAPVQPDAAEARPAESTDDPATEQQAGSILINVFEVVGPSLTDGKDADEPIDSTAEVEVDGE